jgi:hypothetical protein
MTAIGDDQHARTALDKPDPTLPSTVPLFSSPGDIPDIIKSGQCNLCIVGDSITSKSVPPRIPGGIHRTWEPDLWVGRVAHAHRTWNTDGARVEYSSDPGVQSIAQNPGDVFTGGQSAISPVRSLDITCIDNLNEGVVILDTWLNRMDEYYGGDWTDGVEVVARAVYWQDAGMLDAVTIQGLRAGAVASDSGAFSMLGTPGVASIDVNCGAGSGEVRARYRAAVSYDETGDRFYNLTTRFYRPGVVGFQLDSISNGGWTAGRWLEEWRVSDENLAAYLEATDANVFVIWLGTNMTTAEHSDVSGLWRAHVESIIDRLRAAYATYATPGEERFVLVVPYPKSPFPDQRYFQMESTLNAVAQDQSETMFVNLFRYFWDGDGSPTYGGDDNVHPETDEEADIIAAAVWEILMWARTCPADTNRDGRLDSTDFIAFLNFFVAGDPEADFNGDGAVNSQDFSAFLNAFVAGCG